MTHCTENCYERGCYSALPPACTCPHEDRDCLDYVLKVEEELWDEAVHKSIIRLDAEVSEELVRKYVEKVTDYGYNDEYGYYADWADGVRPILIAFKDEIISKINDTKI